MCQTLYQVRFGTQEQERGLTPGVNSRRKQDSGSPRQHGPQVGGGVGFIRHKLKW